MNLYEFIYIIPLYHWQSAFRLPNLITRFSGSSNVGGLPHPRVGLSGGGNSSVSNGGFPVWEMAGNPC